MAVHIRKKSRSTMDKPVFLEMVLFVVEGGIREASKEKPSKGGNKDTHTHTQGHQNSKLSMYTHTHIHAQIYTYRMSWVVWH